MYLYVAVDGRPDDVDGQPRARNLGDVGPFQIGRLGERPYYGGPSFLLPHFVVLSGRQGVTVVDTLYSSALSLKSD